MRRHLYFVCPTDGLEGVIESTFKQESYFLTSLGNSLMLNSEEISEVSELILTKDIQDISFIMSDDNKVFLEAMENRSIKELSSLSSFYHQVRQSKNISQLTWQTENLHLIVLSHHLNDKIKRLKHALNILPVDIKVAGKIYNRQEESFNSTYPELICKNFVSLN
ncbi:hypothetical protein [Ekhidna sp.]